MSHAELLSEVQRLLNESIEARYRGELHAAKIRAQAYADGYMRALGDAGLVSHKDLLKLVTESRVRSAGPAVEDRIAQAG